MNCWTIGCLISIKMLFQTIMTGVDVIVCAIIGIVSCKINEFGIAIEIVLNSTGNKQLTS